MVGKYLKDINLKGSREIFPVYLRLNIMFFKFIHSFEFVFKWYTLTCKTSPEKSDDTKWRKLYSIFFVLFWNLAFMCKRSKARIKCLFWPTNCVFLCCLSQWIKLVLPNSQTIFVFTTFSVCQKKVVSHETHAVN